MNIKYIGNFKDGTGWAKACVYNALSIKQTGVNINCTPIKYNNSDIEIEKDIDELINSDFDNYDIVVNHCLPTEYKWNYNSKNVGFVALETERLSNKFWTKKINLMDEIWVPNVQSQNCLLNSDVRVPIKIFKHRFNYYDLLNNKSQVKINGIEHSYNFAFVGDFSKRKNIESLLRAFFCEFEYFENVNLFLKLNGEMAKIESFTNEVKKRCRKISKSKNPIIINSYLNYFDLMSIIKQCHTFVLPSYGEACCYPALESAAVGLNVLYTEGIGIDNYISGNKAVPVKSNLTPCYGATDALEGLYLYNDFWREIDTYELAKAMREIVLSPPKGDNSYEQYDYRSEETKQLVKDLLK